MRLRVGLVASSTMILVCLRISGGGAFVGLRRRRKQRQQGLWIATSDLESTPRNRFYEALNQVLAEGDFDRVTEDACAPHYQPENTPGRPSIPPGVYFRMLLIGYFEGIESERGICWRCSDSLSLRAFLGLSLTDRVPDHSSLSRIRQRLPESVFATVFDLVLGIVAKHGLLKGQVAGIDSSVLRADASMKAIVRRDGGEDYQAFITRLASEDAGREVSLEEARAFDRKRQKRTSNQEWVSSTDADARITRLKDGRTRLAYKVEHVLDLQTQVLLSARILPGDAGDTRTLLGGVAAANAQIARLQGNAAPEAVIATGAARVEHPATIDSTIATPASPAESDAGDDDPPRDEPGGGAATPAATSRVMEVEQSDDSPALARAVGHLRIAADKGYHKASCIRELKEAGYRTIIPERATRGQRSWLKQGGRATALAVYQNKWRTQRAAGRGWLRKRAEVVERSFAHTLETGGGRRTRLRGLVNVQKRYCVTAAAANLGVLMRKLLGSGTPRALHAQNPDAMTAFTTPPRPTHRPTRPHRPLDPLRALHRWLLKCAPHQRQHHRGPPATTA